MSTQDQDSYFWVGIGASAGGLEAIQMFCKELPQNANMVYIICQHLSPKHKSMLTELIQRNISLKVETLEGKVKAKPNVVYITPPQKDVYIEGDEICLVDAESENIPKPSINKLLVSLAEEKKDHAIGIILSGTGSDGAHGIKSIKACGGLTIAQEAHSAKYEGMPNAAIDTDCVDLVLPPEQIGKHLAKLATELPREALLSLEKAEVKDSFTELMSEIRKNCGVSFKQYKKATLQRRIERRMLARGITNFEEYVKFAKSSKEEIHLLYKDILISVTNFFRDEKAFKELENVIHNILDTKDDQVNFRFWSVGCATGEEAFSLAISLAEVVGGPDQLQEKNIQIFATDVDTSALTVARKGVYTEASMANIPQDIIKKYFVKRKDTYEIIKPLKDIVLFASHNVIEDPPFLRIDLITCRNLLIYFEPELQRKIYNIFHYSLRFKGYLFLGKSESTTQVSQLFRPIHQKSKIFQKRAVTQEANRQFNFANKIRSIEAPTSEVEDTTSTIPQLYQALIEQLGRASVVINDNFDIEHVYGDINPFISLASGKPVLNMAEIVNNAHKHELRALVFKALRTKLAVEGQARKIKIDGKLFKSRLKIYPLQVEDHNDRILLVTFETLNELKHGEDLDSLENSSDKVKELEDELATAREHLQTVIEELETSNEELQSMNEELQSSNEELQSSNEELETTNEELQSANEELVTINDELNAKTVALEQASNQLNNVKESLAFPLIVINEKSRIVEANHHAIKFFGIHGEDINLFKILPEEFGITNIRDIIDDVCLKGNSRKLQLEKYQRYYWLHVTPYFSQNEELSGAILSFIENTDFIKQNQELIRSRQKAQSANLAKSEFLANISHEIRTPLNTIYGVTEIFERNVDEAKKEQLFSVLRNAAENLKELLDDLLDFAKLEAGQLKLEYDAYSIRNLLNRLVKVFSLSAAEKELTLESNIDDALPEELIGDALRIKQVLSNLISNAIKFTQEGKIEISVKGFHQDNGFSIQFRVQDSGVGMDRYELAKIFEKFTQANTSISRRYGGTGLGLSIVKELVDLMNGKVEVESEKDKGTAFIITIPAEFKSIDDAGARRAAKDLERSDGSIRIDNHGFKQTIQRKQEEETTKIDPAQYSKFELLLVEDNDSNIVIFSSYLDELGCTYDVARNGPEAIDLVTQKSYDLIFMDIQMDNMNGFELFDYLKQKSILNGAKVIAQTANVHRDIVEKCEKMGMDGFLSKPIEFKKLEDIMQSNLI
ncbi:Sensory/regulatory protein RpfC [Thalassocella blandensis]|nr:Sensory/regulatory protein RpfC [Thalassocella blandensis]